ncbi:Prxl2a, partial [Symbiodinium sp. KB8]
VRRLATMPPAPVAPPLTTVLTPLPKGTGPDFPASDLVTGGPALVFAIRRPEGVTSAQEAKEAASHMDEFKAAGATRVVALVKEDLENEVKEFREGFWPGEVLMDSEHKFYKALGGGETHQPLGLLSFLGMMLNPFSSSKTKANIKNTTTPGNMKGEGFIAGGCYVLNKDGTPAFSHLEENLGDHAKPE